MIFESVTNKSRLMAQYQICNSRSHGSNGTAGLEFRLKLLYDPYRSHEYLSCYSGEGSLNQ
jgi:hypothetical protein